MLPLAAWPLADRQQIRGVFTDIDDTLTTEGAITPDALQALADLRQAGLPVVAITGRPVGWSLPFAAAWPVDAIVAENGAVALTRAADGGPVLRHYLDTPATRQRNFGHMQAVAAKVLAAVPGVRLAEDSPGRETDIAIDHSEFARLEATQIAQVVAVMQAEGMHATVSSIHINGWFGDHDKRVGARWIARLLYGCDLDAEIGRWAYVGDSTNDQVMFQAFPNAVGVANVQRFLAQLAYRPRYVTLNPRGAGFAEVATAVLSARR